MNKRASRDRTNFLSRLLAIIVIAVLVASAYACYSTGIDIPSGLASAVALTPIKVSGTITDAVSGTPPDNARITLRNPSPGDPPLSVPIGPQGEFSVENVRRGSLLLFEAEGYEPQELSVDRSVELNAALKPIHLSGTVLDSFTGLPVAGASVELADKNTNTDVDGSYKIDGAKKNNQLTVKAKGYATASTTYTGQSNLDIDLRPNTLAGIVRDAGTGNPIKNAHVSAGGRDTSSDESGNYKLADLPSEALELTVTAPGYEKAVLNVKETTRQDVQMKQFVVRGLYMTYYGFGDEGLRSNVIDKIDKTEANGIVIDIKGDRGWLIYKTDVPLAKRIGAADNPTVKDFDSLMAMLKKKNIYTIARVVVFKDNPLATSRPDLAVIDTKTGKPWIDTEGLAWVDPSRQEVWDYDLAIAKEAAKKGFDEIQFDYIRFPTDGSVSTARYAVPNTMENRLEAINGFLSRAKAELKPLGVALSVDVFGYTCWREDDMGIGQRIEDIARYVDYLSPMVYPSTYSDGIPGYRNAVAYPYEIVYYSLKKASERLAGTPVQLRPWLQYFDDYPWATGMPYNDREIRAQKKAAADANAHGWLLWDPANKYARGG